MGEMELRRSLRTCKTPQVDPNATMPVRFVWSDPRARRAASKSGGGGGGGGSIGSFGGLLSEADGGGNQAQDEVLVPLADWLLSVAPAYERHGPALNSQGLEHLGDVKAVGIDKFSEALDAAEVRTKARRAILWAARQRLVEPVRR